MNEWSGKIVSVKEVSDSGLCPSSGRSWVTVGSQVSELCLLDSLGILTHSAPSFSHLSPNSVVNLLKRLS